MHERFDMKVCPGCEENKDESCFNKTGKRLQSLCKPCFVQYTTNRFLWMKIRAIIYKGGECQECGYSKCHATMEFHHLNPSEKDYQWNKLRKRSWEGIKHELDKCVLLCANCHREAHFDKNVYDRVRDWHNARMRKMAIVQANVSKLLECPQCGTDFKPHKGSRNTQKHCSTKCSYEASERVDWPDDLPELVAASSRVKVGKLLGVSDKAVAKRLKRHH